MIDREALEKEAERMWPQTVLMGKWDGATVSVERALLIQRQAFIMGAEWQAEHGD